MADAPYSLQDLEAQRRRNPPERTPPSFWETRKWWVLVPLTIIVVLGGFAILFLNDKGILKGHKLSKGTMKFLFPINPAPSPPIANIAKPGLISI